MHEVVEVVHTYKHPYVNIDTYIHTHTHLLYTHIHKHLLTYIYKNTPAVSLRL